MKQILYNENYELSWVVVDGAHTLKLTKLTPPSDDAKMVLEREEKESWTHTE
jgi:hypothetical protein|tara:strand:+ start:1519 stop:1674 length:156 start_codon:yes stop_codon:yes gene_type:complete